MVEIKKIYVSALTLLSIMMMGSLSAATPIEALRGDSDYMSLVKRVNGVEQEICELRSGVAQARAAYAAGNSGVAKKIEVAELKIFDLQQLHNTLEGQISEREELWALSNIGDGAGGATERPSSRVELPEGDNRVTMISKSGLAESILGRDDLDKLRRCDVAEARVWELFSLSTSGHSRLVELESKYSQTKQESEALKIQQEFNAMVPVVDSLFGVMGGEWNEIYEHKSYCYAVMLESLGRESVLESGEQILRGGLSGVDADEENPYRVAQIYDMQKRAMLSYECSVAQDLGLTVALDSLRGALKGITARGEAEALARVEIKERNFIEYSDVKFSSTPIYKKSSQIPEAKLYPRGRVYRLQLGAYKTAQVPSIFRGAHPLSFDETYGFWTCYVGAFATYAEAEKAQKLCRAKGFKRPEIVVWDDGERRNYGREPLAATKGFRVIVDGVEELPKEFDSLVDTMCHGAEMSKLGAAKYIVATIPNRPKAEEFAEAVMALNDEFVCELVEIK